MVPLHALQPRRDAERATSLVEPCWFWTMSGGTGAASYEILPENAQPVCMWRRLPRLRGRRAASATTSSCSTARSRSASRAAISLASSSTWNACARTRGLGSCCKRCAALRTWPKTSQGRRQGQTCRTACARVSSSGDCIAVRRRAMSTALEGWDRCWSTHASLRSMYARADDERRDLFAMLWHLRLNTRSVRGADSGAAPLCDRRRLILLRCLGGHTHREYTGVLRTRVCEHSAVPSLCSCWWRTGNQARPPGAHGR